MRNNIYLTAGLAAVVAAGLCGTARPAAAQSDTAPLLTPAQYQNDALALSVRRDPAVVAARQDLLKRWAALPLNQVPDGRATLKDAADQAVFLALRTAAADPARPQVIWTEAPAYTIGKLHVPSGRLGDSPDRIYRFAALDPQYSYVIHGHRRAQPSLADFSFESVKPPQAFGLAQSRLSSDDIDVAADGSFTVTADATPTKTGQRNHLYLPPGITSVLIRDTVLDWGAQQPNSLSIERVGGPATPPRSKADVAQQAAREIGEIADADLPFLQLSAKATANQIVPFIRPLAWGMQGSGIALSRFSLKHGEALVVTLDPLGARYLGFVVGNPWQASVTYWNRTGSLNNKQATANPDGTITYVLAAKDPGVANWVDTSGLRDGVITNRWEGLPPGVDIHKAVKDVAVVQLADLAAKLPDAAHIDPAERKQLLAQREVAFFHRTSLD